MITTSVPMPISSSPFSIPNLPTIHQIAKYHSQIFKDLILISSFSPSTSPAIYKPQSTNFPSFQALSVPTKPLGSSSRLKTRIEKERKKRVDEINADFFPL